MKLLAVKKTVLLVLVSVGLAFLAKGQTEYLVKVNPATDNFTKIDSLSGVLYISVIPNYSTFDDNNHHYIFKGTPDGTNYYLYCVNAETGTISSKASFSNDSIIELQYDNSLNVLYGFEAISGIWYLVSINITTGIPSIISILPDVQVANGWTDIETNFNSNNNQFIFQGTDSLNNYYLYSLDVITGKIVSKAPFPLALSDGVIKDMQFSNSLNTLYGLYYNLPQKELYLVSVNTTTGAYTIINSLPHVDLLFNAKTTFDNINKRMIFTGYDDSADIPRLYSVDAINGNIIYNPPAEFPSGLIVDNIAEYRYDDSSQNLYALHWEAVTLPVILLSFTATKKGEQNLLQWATTQEINTSYFEVERSGDWVNFTSIGQVDAAGNSGVAKSYSLVDAKPVSGMNYYRLKMVDKDGKFSYSEIRSIDEAVGFVVSIYPNPVEINLSLNISSDKTMQVQLEVVDNGGRWLLCSSWRLWQGRQRRGSMLDR